MPNPFFPLGAITVVKPPNRRGMPPRSGANGRTYAASTATVVLNRLTLDLGQLIASKPSWIDLFAGWRYWQNKFGLNHKLDPTGGATESTAYVGIAWHAL
jgi:hypothetical protein